MLLWLASASWSAWDVLSLSWSISWSSLRHHLKRVHRHNITFLADQSIEYVGICDSINRSIMIFISSDSANKTFHISRRELCDWLFPPSWYFSYLYITFITFFSQKMTLEWKQQRNSKIFKCYEIQPSAKYEFLCPLVAWEYRLSSFCKYLFEMCSGATEESLQVSISVFASLGGEN